MAFTVLEATKLASFKNFKLVAGHRGLDHLIETVGILDYEFINKIEGQFVKGEFVISSLLFAKDNPDFILGAVKSLIEDGVSGFAIKNIYYNDLPPEVINFANEKAFPIFIFDNTIFFEQIITELMDKIKSINNYEILEAKIDILINKNLNKFTVKELAFEINSSFKEHFFVIYLKEKKYIGSAKILEALECLKRSRKLDLHSTALQYRNGILVILTHEAQSQESSDSIVNTLVESMSIDSSEYFIGISNMHMHLNELDQGIKESIYAQKSGSYSVRSLNHFSEIGVYGILFPYIDDIWLHSFYNKIISPIKSYDEKYHTELLDTAVKYIDNDGRIDETANALFLHKNTIRYRINKIKELLNMEDREGSFYEQLSIAIKLYKIYSS